MKRSLFDVRDGALLVEFPGASDDDANRTAVLLGRRLRRRSLPGLHDAVPAARSLLVVYEPSVLEREDLVAAVERAAAEAGKDEDRGRLLRLPVIYDGEDLADVAGRAGLPPDEFARRHAAALYRVAFVGFAPGFGYLAGLPPELESPRRASPRPRVAAGRVAIGGSWTGVYPSDSPGGWRLIGRTSAVLFDPSSEPPALLEPGDAVQFDEVDELAPPGGVHMPGAPGVASRPVFRVLSAGLFTTIQGGPRYGLGSSGVPPGGAMDPATLAAANSSVGNAVDAPALEVTVSGPELEALGEVVVSPGRTIRAGERIPLGRVERGARAYLAVRGGFVDSRRPGEPARRLSAGDVLSCADSAAGRTTPLPAPELPDEIVLRAVPGPEAGGFDPEQVQRFFATRWRVTPESDRKGLRLEGPPLEHLGSPEIAPAGTVPGTIQVPGSGLPILLGPDGPVTGGYPRLAAVVGADLWLLGQARPGAAIHFRSLTFPEAVSLRRAGRSTIGLP